MKVTPRKGANGEQALIAEELLKFFTYTFQDALMTGIQRDAGVTPEVRKILDDWGLDLEVGE